MAGSDTVLESLSAHDLYLRLARLVERGMTLFIVIQLSTAPTHAVARIALRGEVLRVDPQTEDGFGVTVGFRHHRFLYAAAP